MTEQPIEWTQTPAPAQVVTKHQAEVEGLSVTIDDRGTDRYGIHWSAEGRLEGRVILLLGRLGENETVEEAKAAAIAGARRLIELGVTGSRS